jgi:alpha-ketoglutarate-dependent taurine dioxygenase
MVMIEPTLKRVSATPEMLRVEWTDGAIDEFAGIWLRDNRPADRDPHNGQRLIDIMDVPPDLGIRSAVNRGGKVLIEWDDGQPATEFDLAWLAAHASDRSIDHPELSPRSWLHAAELDARQRFAWISWQEARAEQGARLDWLTHMLRDGIGFVSGVPCHEEAIIEAMGLVGRVAETNYGLVFDVRSVPQPENLAYSDLGLGLHTDNPYRDPVPGFQALHVLIASPEGGDNLFADGFAIAEHLRAVDPGAFAQLTQVAVPFRYRSKDAELYAEKPMIQLSCDGRVVAVHYNSRSIAPLRLSAADSIAFYAAYRRFGALLRDAQFQMRLKLNDGDLVVFDNQRTLHGRMGFSSARHARHLRGCYLSRDSVFSTTALLRRALGAVRA